MAFRSTAASRLVLTGLAVAGAFAGAAGSAAAQGYVYEGEVYPHGYYERYAPLPPAPIPPRAIDHVAVRDFGLVQIDRTIRTASSYVVDGWSAQGRRTRLIIDRYSGDLVDSIALPSAPREAPRVARIAPRDDVRRGPRLVPHPPERPAALKPPVEASAPATLPAPSPAAPPQAAEPVKPTEAQPTTASAPATVAPSVPAIPPAPTPGPLNPATGDAKPQLVNPNDVRDAAEPDRKPPLARAEPSEINLPAIALPPVQIEVPAPSTPRPETPAVPVTPLD